jgi:hypothetical protein
VSSERGGAYAVPEELDERAVEAALSRWLAAPHDERSGIVWVKDGDEVIVWLDSLSVQLEPGAIRVRIDLETEQTGRLPQDVVIAVAEPSAPPSLLAVTDETSRGDERLAARWGQTLQDAAWCALLELSDDAAGIAATAGKLVVHERGPT